MRWILRLLFLALSAVLLVRVYDVLFSTDVSTSPLAWLFEPAEGSALIFAGVAWGFLLFTPGADFLAVAPRSMISSFRDLAKGGATAPDASMTAFAVGVVSQVRRTGLEINDIPQYDIFVTVTPSDEPPFVAKLRQLLDAQDVVAVNPGAALPLLYDPRDHRRLAVADVSDPSVRDALMRWRVDRGLIRPELVSARMRGISVPASVLALRPTGKRVDSQVELEVQLLLTPDGSERTREATTWVCVYPQALSHVQVGSPVVAMYEPSRPDVVAMTIEDDRDDRKGAS